VAEENSWLAKQLILWAGADSRSVTSGRLQRDPCDTAPTDTQKRDGKFGNVRVRGRSLSAGATHFVAADPMITRFRNALRARVRGYRTSDLRR